MNSIAWIWAWTKTAGFSSGAGWLFLVARVFEAGGFENTEPSEVPGELVMLGAALGFIGACVAMYGVAR